MFFLFLKDIVSIQNEKQVIEDLLENRVFSIVLVFLKVANFLAIRFLETMKSTHPCLVEVLAKMFQQDRFNHSGEKEGKGFILR